MKKDNLNHLIVGIGGEVGTGLLKFLCKKTNVWGIDKKEFPPYPDHIDVMHIAISYKARHFEYIVKEYKRRFKPKMVIIHSTVPVGVCDQLRAIHSPIRGVHPKLHLGIKTFLKYFGGKDSLKAAKLFQSYGCPVLSTNKARHTEALKLWDTTQYGWQIVLMKEIYSWCKKNKVPFEFIYQHANFTYNEGYKKLDRPEVVRPYLDYKKGKIGGHCVVQNLEMIDSFISSVIKFKNKKY